MATSDDGASLLPAASGPVPVASGPVPASPWGPPERPVSDAHAAATHVAPARAAAERRDDTLRVYAKGFHREVRREGGEEDRENISSPPLPSPPLLPSPPPLPSCSNTPA